MHSVKTISNNRIKEIVKLHQKKYRDELGLFIAEGFKILEELINKKAEIVEVIALDSLYISNLSLPISIVNEATMKKISTTDTACEILTIAKKQEYSIDEFCRLKKNSFIRLN